ncbi:MAG: MFS transporter, partial [Pseudomonadota bacterium]
RMDRRSLILAVALAGGIGAMVGFFFMGSFPALLFAAFVIGGMSNPLYALLIAYTNDFLEHEDMAAASGGLIFINGIGAIAGPLITGWMMGVIGPRGFFLFVAILLFALAAYAAYRMTQRAISTPVDDTTSYAPIFPSTSPVAVEVAQEYYIETALEEGTDAEDADTRL